MRRVALASVCALAVGVGGGYATAQLLDHDQAPRRTYEQGVKDGRRQLERQQARKRAAEARARSWGGGFDDDGFDQGW